MRTDATMPAAIRLALLRDALVILDPKRNPGTRAEAAAVLCETLLGEAMRTGTRDLVAEAAMVAAETITTGPVPAGPRSALLDALRDAVGLLADGYEDGAKRAAVAARQKPRRRAELVAAQ